MPLILARAQDPELASVDLRSAAAEGAGRAAEICRRITATGALAIARERALELVAAAKRGLPRLPDRQRGALELVADGVVERYL